MRKLEKEKKGRIERATGNEWRWKGEEKTAGSGSRFKNQERNSGEFPFFFHHSSSFGSSLPRRSHLHKIQGEKSNFPTDKEPIAQIHFNSSKSV